MWFGSDCFFFVFTDSANTLRFSHFCSVHLDQRLGKWLYSIDDSLAKQEDEDFFMNSEMETAVSRDNVYQSKGEQQLEPINLLKVNDEKKPQSEFKQDRESDILTVVTEDEDISFLLNRSISMEKEQSETIEEPIHEVDYLSEIEGSCLLKIQMKVLFMKIFTESNNNSR